MFDIFSSPLSGMQWALFLAVPPAILALYFLKLRRQPLEVPSTFLWHRTLEDMHVNSLWQRLRQSLLLFLQLLMIALLMLACLRPNWMDQQAIDGRVILLVDASASMSTTDGDDAGATRLEAAKKQASAVVERMKRGSRVAAMVISFADGVIDIQPFTTDRRLLLQKIEAIQPTNRTSDIREALRAAAGLANPGRSGDAGVGDTPAAEPLPADVYILSDGAYRSIPDFSWGNLQPHYIPVGRDDVENVAVAGFNAAPIPGRLDKLQALAEVRNFGDTTVTAQLSLYLDDRLLDAASTTVEPGQPGGADFTFDRPTSGKLKVVLEPGGSVHVGQHRLRRH